MKMKLLIILCSILFFFPISKAQSDSGFVYSRTAPNFMLESIDGEILELNDFIGKGPILLCFWASCCKSAVTQIEDFSGLFDEYHDAGFTMLAIAVDEENTVAKVKPYAMSKGYKFPVVYDSDGKVARLYYAYDVPFSVLIDKSGKITYSHLGYMKGDEIELNKNIKDLLNK